MGWEGAILATLIAGTSVAAYGQYQQMQAAKTQAETEANMAAYNAKLVERQAEEERSLAAVEAGKFEKRGEALQAAQRVLYGRAGVEFRGSPLAVIEDTAKELELDRQMILRGGEVAVAYRRSEAAIERMRGGAARARARYAGRAAPLAAAGTLLTGLGTAGYYGYQMRK